MSSSRPTPTACPSSAAPAVAGALLDGYEISGITRFQTGALLTPTANTSTGIRRADYLGGDVNLPNGERTVAQYFDTAAFRAAPNDRRGNAGVGIIQGPGLQLWDLSVRKKFIFSETKNLELRGTSSTLSTGPTSAIYKLS